MPRVPGGGSTAGRNAACAGYPNAGRGGVHGTDERPRPQADAAQRVLQAPHAWDHQPPRASDP
ncbi:MAG: hypothetical protein ACE5KM_14815, partial [Planctomycetaceae bacterium]